MKTDENMNERQALKTLLESLSVEFRSVVLSSGQPSNVYVDCKQTSLHPEGALLLGELLYEAVLKLEARCGKKAEAVGGMSIGADPLATAVSLTALKKGRSLPAFLVRKTAKAHGTKAYIEGAKNFPDGASVILLEDVITTGGSALLAAERLREADYNPFAVAAIVDREVGGMANLLSANLTSCALYNLSEFRETT